MHQCTWFLGPTRVHSPNPKPADLWFSCVWGVHSRAQYTHTERDTESENVNIADWPLWCNSCWLCRHLQCANVTNSGSADNECISHHYRDVTYCCRIRFHRCMWLSSKFSGAGAWSWSWLATNNQQQQFLSSQNSLLVYTWSWRIWFLLILTATHSNANFSLHYSGSSTRPSMKTYPMRCLFFHPFISASLVNFLLET